MTSDSPLIELVIELIATMDQSAESCRPGGIQVAHPGDTESSVFSTSSDLSLRGDPGGCRADERIRRYQRASTTSEARTAISLTASKFLAKSNRRSDLRSQRGKASDVDDFEPFMAAPRSW